MSWFARPIESVETAPRLSVTADLHAAQLQLSFAKQELIAAQRALQTYRGENQDLRVAHFDGNPAICLGALQMHPTLRSLEHALRQKVQRFDVASSEFAAAKRAAGLGTY
jgi:hypothetical protein